MEESLVGSTVLIKEGISYKGKSFYNTVLKVY